MSKDNNKLDVFDVASFFAGVKSQLSDLNQKVVEGSNLKTSNIDVLKVAKEFDQSRGINFVSTPISQPPTAPTINVQSSSVENENQLLFNFDKKYTLNDIFSKIDDTYRKVVSLESEVFLLKKLLLEEKKR